MAVLSYNEILPKCIITYNNEPYEVLSSHIFRMQMRKPVNQTKLRHLVSGKVIEISFHQNETMNEAEVDTMQAVYLYTNKGESWFAEVGNLKNRFSFPEEVVQDAFTKMYLYADKYHVREGASFSSWAYTILNRVAYTRYRAKSIERGKRAELLPEHYESLPDARAEFLEDLSIRNEVLAALAKLPEAAAKILRLQFIEGKTQEEIAQAEDLSIPAVKTRIHRAKKLFKEVYDAQHYE